MAHRARRDDGTLAVDGYPDLRRVVVLGEPRLLHAIDWTAFMAARAAVGDAALAARQGGGRSGRPHGDLLHLGHDQPPKGAVHSHRPIRNPHERAQLLGMTDARRAHELPAPVPRLRLLRDRHGRGADRRQADPHRRLRRRRALDLAEQERATILHGFDTHWPDLIRAQERRPRRLALRLGTLPAGMESSTPIADRVQEVFCPTVSGWGMSETWAFVSCATPSHTRRAALHASGYPMIDWSSA